MEKMRAYLSVQEALGVETELAKACRSIALTDDLMSACGLAAREAQRLLPCNAVFVSLGDETKVRVVAGWTEAGQVEIETPLEVSPSGEFKDGIQVGYERNICDEYSRVWAQGLRTTEGDTAILTSTANWKILTTVIAVNDEAAGELSISGPDDRILEAETARDAQMLTEALAEAIEASQAREEGHPSGQQKTAVDMARALHGTVAQGIFAVEMRIASMLAGGNLDPQAEESLRELKDLVSEVKHEVRSVILMPYWETDPVETLISRVKREIKDHERLGGAAVTIISEDARKLAISRDAAEAIQQVAREALSNVRKHSQATRVIISISKITSESGHSSVSLSVQDNGVGISVPSEELGSERLQFGIADMRRLVAQVHGALWVENIEDGGLMVRVRIPVSE